MFIIDTNVFILASQHQEPDFTFLRQTTSKAKIYISVITIAEFLSRPSRQEKIFFEKIIDISTILDIDEGIARLAATYRSKFLKASRIKLLDYLIAAQAKKHHLTLITNNKVDFPMQDIKVISPTI